jgi:hypothetical protein
LWADINARVMKGYNAKAYKASRADLFATIDKPALKQLPDEPYAFVSESAADSSPTTTSKSTATGIPRRSA